MQATSTPERVSPMRVALGSSLHCQAGHCLAGILWSPLRCLLRALNVLYQQSGLNQQSGQ